MFFHKKISSDFLLLILLVVRLRLDSDFGLHERYMRQPESREVFLGSSSAYTQITFHSPYSNIQYPHPKSLEFNEQDEAAILFNRLNYFNSVRERSNLIAYYASSPDVQSTGTTIENANAEASTGGDSPPGDPSLPTMAEASLETSGGTSCERESSTSSLTQELSPEDRDLIEILWKQDIDLGVTRDAYDSRPCLEVEKLKDVEYSKENLQEFYMPGDAKECEENESTPNALAGFNYTIDSETGEFIFEELSGLNENEIPGARLLDNDTFPPLNSDSYLPFNEDDIQLANLTDIFPPCEFPDLLNDTYTDSDTEYLLSHIQDFEKELESFIDNDPGDESMYSQPGDVFPNLDDCWPDSTTMLPLLALGNAHQTPFVSLSPRPEPTYQSSNPVLPLSTGIPSRSSEGFTGIFHTSSLEASTTEETFHTIPTSLGPSSVGCALAESIATLHNDTDPLPSNSLINTVYNPDLPDLLYCNQSLSAPHNELLIHDLFTDDDFQLENMSSEVNQRILNEDHPETSSDSASLASGRVPSVSDCADWVDSCSESSSHHGENRTHSYASHTPRANSFGPNHQSSEHYHSALPPKRQRNLENNDAGHREFNGAAYEHSNGSEPHYFSIKSEYSDVYENNTGLPSSPLPTYRKFDYSNTRSTGSVSNNILQHNHSYHLPFTNDDSHYKPVVRDKTRSLSEEEACNKDEKRAKELNLPISIDDIINLAIEEYNERLSKYELTDQQLNLIRDIRRRGKNKVAAQNCRKRKMDQINSLQQDLDSLQNEKMQLKSKQDHLLQEKHRIEDKYAQLYQIVSQYTNCKPPGSSNSFPVHNNNVPATPDIVISDDDSELKRGARTKRKLKK